MSPTATPAKPAPLSFMSFEGDPKCSVLYIGPNKSGKTHNVLSWQEAGPMLLIYWDSNPATVNARLDTSRSLAMSPSPKEFDERILPVIDSGDLVKLAIDEETERKLAAVRVIGFDTYSRLSTQVLASMRDAQGRISQGDRGIFLNTMLEWTAKLANTAKMGKFHFIATAHERTYTDDNGRIVDIAPAIEGQFRDVLSSFFDSVFWTKVSTKNEIRDGKPAKVTSFFVSTITDGFRCGGDGLGGGRYNKLPPTLPGTYSSLAKAWGLRSLDNDNDKNEGSQE